MPGAEEKESPRDVIERIRTEDYLLDIDEESDRVKRGAKSLQKKLNNALKLLSDDLYSKKAHFVLELIQNADDNNYEEGVVPQLVFNLTSERLVLVNNETGFEEAHVRALCSVGESSKANKSGYIGEKGIGFKSVFTVSNSPEIHSNDFHFRFDRADQSNLLGFVVPHWCDQLDEAKPNVTTIILPFAKEGFESSQVTLEGLDARLLLFLSKVRKIVLQRDGDTVTYLRRDEEGLSYLSTRTERPNTQPKIEESHFVRVSVDFKMKEVPDEKRPDILTSSVVLAFPVDSKGTASPESSSQVFAFLPIRQVGFKFSIQADFILNSSREDILTDREWNKLLRNAIAVAFKTAIATFKKTDELAFSFLKFLPADGEISDPFFRSLSDGIIGQLAQTECLPSASGQWKHPSDLRIAEKRFRDLFPPTIAMELFGFDYVDNRVQGSNELLRRLGAQDIVVGDYLNVFNKHGTWLKQQPLDWKARFYAMLADLDVQKLTAGLALLPCMPTNTGDLAVPTQTSVFYPLSRGKKYGFELELVIIDSELLDMALQHSEKVKDLFAALKVKSDDPYDLVTSHILPKHQGKSWMTSEKKALLGHLRYVKDKFKEYLDGAAKAGKTETQAIQSLRDGMWLGTKHNKDGTWQFDRAERLYFSKEYKPQFCIESLLGEAIAEARLVSPDYLVAKAKDIEAEADSWRQFFQRFGLCVSPRLEAIGNGDWQCSDELRLLLESSHSTTRKTTLECIDQNWSQYAGRLTYNLQVGRSSMIAKDTKFAVTLRSTQTPTKKKTSVALSDAFYPTKELLDLLGDQLPYVEATLSEKTLDACRITYRLDARACIKRLQQLKAEGGDTVKQLQAIYRNLECLWDSDSAYIKQAFVTDGLIRIKGTHSTWASPSQVAWRSNGPFMDSLYPALQGQYRDFSGFFINKLGIAKELPTEKWVEALSRLGDVESVEERRREALSIYKRANRDLTPRFGRDDDIPAPDWLDTFEGNEVFLNHRDELVSNNEQLFANDAPDLASLFRDEEDISLLGVPAEEVPRIGRLLDATSVQRLSASVVIEILEAADGRLDTTLTSKVQRSVYYFGRILYSKSHENFQHALEQGNFARLRELEVLEVPELKLSVSLDQTCRTTTAEIAQEENRILFKAGARSLKDRLAFELCKFLGAPEELADTFARVLMEESAESAEDFLKVRNIGLLPPDLQEALDGTAGQLFPAEEEEYVPEGEETDTDQPAEADEHPVEKFAQGRDVTTTAPTTGHIAATTPATPKGASAFTPSTPVPKVIEPQQPSTMTGEKPEDKTPLVSSDVPAHTYTWDSKGEGPVRSRPKHKKGTQPRAKSGRLMSYAASPGDSNRPNAQEDPAKTAAREATGKAAVEYFIATQAARWKSLTPMPHNNRGFDVKAVAHDGSEELIEVKGQSAGWTEDGVALTPPELETAQQKGDRYWLCVVENVHDEKRRALYLLRNPYGLTQQFRFDSGWKSAAISNAAVPMKPDAGLHVDIPDVGHGRIQSVRKKGRFFSLHVILDDGRQVNKLFNPATMKLSKK